MNTPTCELSAGTAHNANPPVAAVEVVMEWETRDGDLMRRIKYLCQDCFLDKAEEFTEHAREGRHSLLIVQSRYSDDARLPVKGRTIGRNLRNTDRSRLIRDLRKARKGEE
jgi:hypothetical protein